MVTIVIPVFNLSGDRYRNFWFVFSRICADGLPLIVAEQYMDCSLLGFPPGVGHLKYKSSSPYIEKSKLINEAVKMVETEYVWINDADVWTNYRKVKKKFQKGKITSDAVKPFKYFVKFDQDETERFMSRQKVSSSTKDHEAISDYGAGSFIIKKSIIEAEPMNEEFIGWGFEDIEWGRKIQENHEIEVIDLVGAHMYHDQPKVNRSRNEKVYKRMRREINLCHILNLVDFESGTRLHEEQKKAIGSIQKAKKNILGSLKIVAAVDERDSVTIPDGWLDRTLPRTADKCVEGCPKNFAFLKDLMDIAYEYTTDRDSWILFTNSDCFVTEAFYKEIAYSVSDVILFHRDDIDRDGNTRTFEIGVDGLAVRRSVWKDVRNDFADYLIGVPCWDTYAWYYFVKNSDYDVSHNLGGLKHYKHERTWDFYNPDEAGQYNKDLMQQYVDEDKATWHPMSLDNPGDTAVIMAVWGQPPNRISSTRKVLSKLNEQFLNFHLVFVEMLFEGERSVYEDYVDGEHIIVEGTDANRDVFQKEALWNIGASHAKDFKYLIFCDSDIWSKDPFWFYKIRNKLLEDPRTVTQGANFSYDTEDEGMHFQTLLGKSLLVDSGMKHNPGLIYGMTRSYYDDIEGFNPLFLASCGDSGFINEVFNSRKYEQFLRSFPFFTNNLRDVREAIPSVVDVDIIHEHHGQWDTRNYVNVDYAINAFRKDLTELIQIGKNKTAEWINPDCKERIICREGKHMKKRDDVVRIFKQNNLNYLPKRVIFNRIPFCTYDMVEDYLSEFFPVYYIGNDGRDIETGIPYEEISHDDSFVLTGSNIFRPDLFDGQKGDFYFTFIRDPVEMFNADYSFCHSMQNPEEIPVNFVENHGNTVDVKKRELEPSQYIDWFLECANNKFFYMCYYMGLDDYDFVGTVENAEYSVKILCQHLFLPFRKKNVYYEDETRLLPRRYRRDEIKKVFRSQSQKYKGVVDYYHV